MVIPLSFEFLSIPKASLINSEMFEQQDMMLTGMSDACAGVDDAIVIVT